MIAYFVLIGHWTLWAFGQQMWWDPTLGQWLPVQVKYKEYDDRLADQGVSLGSGRKVSLCLIHAVIELMQRVLETKGE